MQIRKLDKETDLDLFNSWWIESGLLAPYEALLPPLGFVVEHKGKQVAMAFLAMMLGMGVYYVQYVVVNPEIAVPAKARAIVWMLESLELIALNHDYTHGFILTAAPGLVETLKLVGWQVCDSDLTLLVKQ